MECFLRPPRFYMVAHQAFPLAIMRQDAIPERQARGSPNRVSTTTLPITIKAMPAKASCVH
jgi:hypothetical protein